MAFKDLAVPALAILGTLYLLKGCNNEKICMPSHTEPQPQPQHCTQQEPVQQKEPELYQVPEEPETTIIHRRIIRRIRRVRTTTTTTVPVQVPVYTYGD